MTKQVGQKKAVSEKVLTLLGVMGIGGLILLAFGVYSIFEISKLIGLTLVILGVLVYVAFVLIEKKLKLL
ncbi:MAG TPA: hypothetical protein VEF91_01140 [Verrucomicrobiae bacterium]|nr:hypothetical protein [Verrucomicrobiae bacterium]